MIYCIFYMHFALADPTLIDILTEPAKMMLKMM